MSEWNKKRLVMRRYDQSAKAYDTLYREEQEAKIRTAMNNLTLNRDSVILDAGCGTGLLFEHVAEKSKFIIGTDISRGILREAEKKAKHYQNVGLIRADADKMPFQNQTFDMVFAITLLQNTPNPQATLNEVKRVSKPDTIIVITGLRKVFTIEGLTNMLRHANLAVEVMKKDEHVREFICVCRKICQ